MVGRREQQLGKAVEDIKIGKDIPEGFSFYGNAILVKRAGEIRAYEARCTHLGCRIHKVEGDEIVCQCHGSRFNWQGQAVKGPALKSLRELSVDKTDNGVLVIKMTE